MAILGYRLILFALGAMGAPPFNYLSVWRSPMLARSLIRPLDVQAASGDTLKAFVTRPHLTPVGDSS